jgi:uncharacterized protein
MDSEGIPSGTSQPPKWQVLNLRQRRVAGVLVEKAKTTPDAYPMTLNGIVTGCNQKSNRDPQMNLSPDDVEQVLEELREMGAVAEVQGTGRVAKYRHYMYEWLGVDKFEIAVMTELLLRGEQTLGELRQRASRMEPINDLATLEKIVHALVERKLMIELTPPGRGQMVTHGLYKDRELPELRARYSGPQAPRRDDSYDDDPPPARAAAPSYSGGSSASANSAAPPMARGVTPDMLAELQVEVAELRAEVGRLRMQVRELEEKIN